MYNYFVKQVLIIDIFLAGAVAGLAVIIILYILAKNNYAKKRNNKLSGIKKNVYALSLSGAKFSADTCVPLTIDTTSRQFLDITMNRDGIFFNENEQDILKSCFNDPAKIKRIERTALKAHNKWKKIEAILILSYLNDKNASHIFERSSYSIDEDVRYFSIVALGRMKNERSARILIDLIKKSSFSRRKIVSMLENFPPDIVSIHIMPLLQNKNPEVRFWALKLLSRLDPGKYLSEISKLAKDPSDEVRSAVCECIGNSGMKTGFEKLSESLKDKSWLVRSSAVKAVSELLGDDCIPKIMDLLGDNSLSVLAAVKEVLVVHIDAAMPYIEKIYAGNDRMAKMICVEAVEESKRDKVK